MSYVNNVIVTFSVSEEEREVIKAFNAALARIVETGQGFRDMSDNHDWYGGSKCLEHHVYVAAFNYIHSDQVSRALAAVEWKYPEDVRLFWCGQEEDAFEPVDWQAVAKEPE